MLCLKVKILPIVLLSFSLCNSAKIRTDDDVKTKDMPTMSSSSPSTSVDDEMGVQVDMQMIMSQCNETFRFDPVLITAYWQALNESGTFPDETDKNPKCFVRCVLEKSMVVSMDSMFDPTRAALVFAGERGGKTMDDLETMAKECADDRRESCKCERAYGFMKCLMEKEIEKYDVYKFEDNNK